jgi:25S rRNA (adenine2142-N1)-methyltransferase
MSSACMRRLTDLTAGQMLRVAHAALRPGGLLFVALPAPCVQNSRYLTPEHFTALLADAGFQQLEHRARPGGRLAYWLFRSLLASSAKGTGDFEKKRVLRTGADRNNFCITLG